MTKPIVQSCPRAERKCVEILVTGDDEQPIADLGVALREGDRMLRDKTDSAGFCRFDGITAEQKVQLGFVGLDGAAWELVTKIPLRADVATSASLASFSDLAPSDEDPPEEHEVKPSECLLRIGYERGFLPETLWSYGPNTTLWGKHQSKSVLKPGLVVQIPPKRRRWVDADRGHLHLVHRIGIPVMMSVRILDAIGRPRRAAPYVLKLERASGEALPHRGGITDGEGFVHAAILPDVVRGTLMLTTPRGDREWTLALDIGALRPADDPLGAKSRLANLGYRPRAQDGVWPVVEPLAAFQDDHEQPPGELDDLTAAELSSAHLS